MPGTPFSRLNTGFIICTWIAVVGAAMILPLWLRIGLWLAVCISPFALLGRMSWSSSWPRLVRVAVAFLLAVALSWIAIPQYLAQWKMEHPVVNLKAYSAPGPYPEGLSFAGMEWKKQYADVRLDVSTAEISVHNLKLVVQLDTSIAGIGQVSHFPDVSARPVSFPVAWLYGTTNGVKEYIPIAPQAGKPAIAPVYAVECKDVPANVSINLAVASVAVAAVGEGNVFAPRKQPSLIRVSGSYESRNGDTHRIEFTSPLVSR